MSDEGAREARELRQCWTCRMNAWCEVSHSSQDDGGQLYRCANCKAIYPEAALSRTPPVSDRDGEVERGDDENSFIGDDACYLAACRDSLEVEGFKPNLAIYKDLLATADRLLASLPHPEREERLKEALEKALPFLGSAASRSQIICGVDAGELYFVVEDILASKDHAR